MSIDTNVFRKNKHKLEREKKKRSKRKSRTTESNNFHENTSKLEVHELAWDADRTPLFR